MGGCYCGQRGAFRPIGLYFGQPKPAHGRILGALYFLANSNLAQRTANDVSDRNWGDGGRVGVISDEKVINFQHSPNSGLVSCVPPSTTITNSQFCFLGKFGQMEGRINGKGKRINNSLKYSVGRIH